MAFYQEIPQGQMDFQQYSNVVPDTGAPLSIGILAAFSTSGHPGEPSLLEELGINFQHIKQKTLLALNPKAISAEISNDGDLTGPVLFCLIFAVCLLLAGKVHFGYIYGVALVGTVSLHFIFKLMSDRTVDFVRTASVLGYCLLPLVPVAFLGIFMQLDNMMGYILSVMSVIWATYSASGFFVMSLGLDNVRPLIAYPVAMFYSVFVLMAVFKE